MDKLTQAKWADNLLKDDFFIKVIDDLKNQQIGAILSTNADGIDEREDAYRTIKTIDLIVGHLQSIAAEKQIREKKWRIL
jgi:hypothetical protein